MIHHFLVIIILMLLSIFFSAIETALFSLSRIDRNRIQKYHSSLAKWVLYHLKHPRQALSTIVIGNLIVNVLATTIVTLWADEIWGVQGISLALAVFSVILILFGEMIPKIVAVRRNESISLAGAFPLFLISWVLFPIWKVTRLASDWILGKIMKERPESIETISEDELKAMVKVGEEEGILDREERRMIQKIFDLGEHPVREIMTPRVQVLGLDMEDSVEKHLQVIRSHHHTQLPVYKGTIDNIQGVIFAQEYVLNRSVDITTLLSQPLFVPQTKRIDDLLGEFRSKKQNFAVCVDEFGGTAGIVTLEDILEEVFGEFYDEYAKVENPIRPYGYHEYLVEAKIPLSELNEKLGLQLEAKEASTLGGFILEQLEEVPEKGSALQVGGCEIRIQEVIRQRYIRSVLVKVQKS